MKRVLAFSLAALLLAGCTKVGTVSSSGSGSEHARKNAYTEPHVLRIGDTQEFDTLNPLLATSLILGNLSQLTMAYLVRYGADNRPVPELATVVPTQANGGVSKDGLRITWHLRRGVKWSDGVPFDADDVVFTTNAVNNPRNNVPGRDGWDLITKIDEPDKYTVIYHMKKPYSGYLPSFFGSAGANPCVIPKHILGNLPDINHAPYNSKPVGIGPFRYTEWVRGDHITLEANPYYWRGQPKIKKVIYRFIPDRNTLLTQMRTGELDMWTYVSSAYYDRIHALPNVATFRGPSYLYNHITFNTSHPVFSDVRVRQALRFATDRKEIRDKINHGIGILQESSITPASPFFVKEPMIPYDPAKANQLLDAAGWKRGADGIRAKNGVKMNLDWAAPAGSPDGDALIELVRAMWQRVGVSITAKHYDTGLYFQLVGGIIYGGKFDVTSFAWQLTPDNDLNPETSCALFPPNGQNVARLCDPKLEPLLQEEKTDYDEAKRKATIAKAMPLIINDAAFFTLYIREDIHAYNSDLTGWHPNNTTPFDDFLSVDI